MRRLRTVLFLVLLACCCGNAQRKPTEAEKILGTAQKQAAAEHKAVFLIFGASWCGPCKRLERFLGVPANRQVIEKYFVTAHLSVAEEYGGNPARNTPGADKLFTNLGGPPGEVPFLVMLDETGSPIVNSNRPEGRKTENIGYPEEPEEISWFMTMLRKAAPAISSDEAQTMESSLQKLAKGH